MRAVLVTEPGATPAAAEVPEPIPGGGEVLVELLAASLNPVDLAIASGHFYAGHPPLPYVPCIEAAGRGVADGRYVFVLGGGLGVARNGTASERFAAPADALVDLPAGADPTTAAALGTAGLAGWLALSWAAAVQPGETVLVLGATGATGTIAVQAARHLGAARVVAAGRNRQRLAELGDLADETVVIEGDDLAGRLQQACDPGADVVFDPLWGPPLVAALTATARGARVIQIGATAGTEAVIDSTLVRSRQLRLQGYSNFAVPRLDLVDTYRTMVDLSVDGRLRLPVTAVAFAEVGRAWDGVGAAGGKFVIVPGEE